MADNKTKKELSINDYESASVTNTYTSEMLKDIAKHSNAITTALSSIAKNYEKVIFNLYWIYKTKSYVSFGYDSIMTYAYEKFGFKKSSTYDFITIAERFGNDDFTAFDAKYKDYEHSKLSLIADKSDTEIESLELKPDMSVKEIKALVKKHDSDSKSVQSIADKFLKLNKKYCNDSKKPDSQESLVIKEDNEVSLPDSSGSTADDSIEDIKYFCLEYIEHDYESYGWSISCVVRDYLNNHVNLSKSLFSDDSNFEVFGFSGNCSYKASVLSDKKVVRFSCSNGFEKIFDVSFERLAYEKFVDTGFEVTICKGKRKIESYLISSIIEDSLYQEFMKHPDCKITITLNNSNDNDNKEKGGKDT